MQNLQVFTMRYKLIHQNTVLVTVRTKCIKKSLKNCFVKKYFLFEKKYYFWKKNIFVWKKYIFFGKNLRLDPNR